MHSYALTAIAAANVAVPSAEPVAERDTVPVPTVVAWSGGAAPYRFVRLRLDDTPREYEYVPAAVPSAEPVAYKIYHPANPNCSYLSTELPSPTRSDTCEADEYFRGKAVPLYAAPQPAAEPLSDEQIADMWSPHPGGSVRRPILGWGKVVDFARAIEQFHGIGATREPKP